MACRGCRKREKKNLRVGVNIWETADAPLSEPARTERALAAASFAGSPLMSAAAALQSPKPRGSRKGEMDSPRCARRLSSGEEVICRSASRFSRSHIRAEAISITVKAFFHKIKAAFKSRASRTSEKDASRLRVTESMRGVRGTGRRRNPGTCETSSEQQCHEHEYGYIDGE